MCERKCRQCDPTVDPQEKKTWAEKQKNFILDFVGALDVSKTEDQMAIHFIWFSIKHEATRSLDTPQWNPDLSM